MTTAIVLVCVATGAAAQEAAPGYNGVIRPLLSNTCFQCHGPDAKARKSALRLDVVDGAYGAGKSGAAAIVPGDRTTSEVWKRISSDDPNYRMPPPDSGKELSADGIALIGAWIDAGAEYEPHWAFVAPERPEPPEVENADWPRNAMDRFVLARLEAAGIAPSPEADRVTLIRRVYLDLIGLPPTPEEVAAFRADDSPDAFERVVDELLASPHFGERWARHWLDAARYADSNGYSIDSPRSIWPYRDWVINAFNADMPFDQFVIEQIAGDLLPDATQQQIVATGFNRNTMINEEGGIDPEEFRLEAVADRVNTVGDVFLGLTMGCARCHDHKYDPIKQREYYQLFAYFNNDEETTATLLTAEERAELAAREAEIAEGEQELAAYLDRAREEGVAAWEAALTLGEIRERPFFEQEIFFKAPEKRNEEERELLFTMFKKEDREYRRLKSRVDRLKNIGRDAPTSLVLAARTKPRETRLMIAGDFTRLADPVEPGVPAVLHGLPDERTGTRLDLAKWIVDPANPLFPRVTANRFWQRLFGTGIVATENDFGMQGELPTHPELLDWLATEFIAQDWRAKALLKTMVMSATYRQSSNVREDLREIDPTNQLLARQNRLRLDAEIIRDSGLVASGLLDERVGGPSVYPPQPEGVMNLGQRARPWNVSNGGDQYRRGLYTFFYRGTPYYGLTVFDAPNAQTACTRRMRSNTPLQALTLLNDPSYVEMAAALAARMVEQGPADTDARIASAFQWCHGRIPSDNEIAILRDLVEPTADSPEGWLPVARALLNTDEFITRE